MESKSKPSVSASSDVARLITELAIEDVRMVEEMVRIEDRNCVSQTEMQHMEFAVIRTL